MLFSKIDHCMENERIVVEHRLTKHTKLFTVTQKQKSVTLLIFFYIETGILENILYFCIGLT